MKNLYPIVQTAGRFLLDSVDLQRRRLLRERISRMAHQQRLYWRWVRAVYTGPSTEIRSGHMMTVLLQSYQRPWNMDRLARAVARCSFVNKIILSNNHPGIELKSRLTLRDPRLVVIQNPVHRRAGFRWHLAREENADYMLAFDDDVFLFPAQIARLFELLIRDPEVPHGLFGTRYHGAPALTREERKKTESYVYQKEAEVDVIHRVYGVGRILLEDYFKYLERSKVYDPLAEDSVGDDIALSFASKRRPRVHDLGEVLLCPTNGWPRIALHRKKDFFLRRQQILKECFELHPRDSGGPSCH